MIKDEITDKCIEAFNKMHDELSDIEDSRTRHDVAGIVSAEDFDIGV